MTLQDWLDALNVNLIVQRYHNQRERWCAHFEHCEVKDGSCLVGEAGNGESPFIAIQDYIEKIKGKRLVFNAFSKEHRLEVTFPERVTWVNSGGES